MSKNQPKTADAVATDAGHSRRRPACADITRAQNENLNNLCSRKVNVLSCRCSGCETDDRYPVLTSPSDAVLVNTANDGSGGFLTSGTDSQWMAGLGGPAGPGTVPASSWIPAFVVVNSTLINNTPPGAWVNSPFSNASWISYFQDGAQGPDEVDAYFRYTFNLGSNLSPATFVLDMDFFADNCVYEIYVNGCPQSTTAAGAAVLPQNKICPPDGDSPYATRGFDAKCKTHIRLDNCWQRCNNEIIVHVKSGSPYLGFMAQNAVEAASDDTGCDCDCDCAAVEFPDIKPCITVKWGDSPCDGLETDDVEVLCITACNCFSNVTFGDLSIGQILVTDMAGNPVPTLPDGTPSIQVVPSGPICFGDIGPCTEKGQPTCVSRELVVQTRGAVAKSYRLTLNGICFTVCHEFQSSTCFTLKLCKD